MRRKKSEKKDFEKKIELRADEIKRSILRDAKALEMPEGTADVVADKVSAQVMAWAEKRAVVTRDDLNRQIAKELAKYHQDLAYVYQNRGKII